MDYYFEHRDVRYVATPIRDDGETIRCVVKASDGAVLGEADVVKEHFEKAVEGSFTIIHLGFMSGHPMKRDLLRDITPDDTTLFGEGYR